MSSPTKKSGRQKPSLSHEEVSAARESGALGRYVGSQLRLTHIAALDALEAAFAPFNSSPIRFALLEHVNERPGSTQATLADILDVDRTTLVPMVADLERKGLIRRSSLSRDRRAAQLWLTSNGRKLLTKLRPLAAEHERCLCGDMTSEEKAALVAILTRIRQNISGRE